MFPATACLPATASLLQGLEPSLAYGIGDYLPHTPGASAPFVLNFIMSPGADCVADLSLVLRYYGISLSFSQAVGYLAAYLGAVLSISLLALLLAARRVRR